jgi:hypothetical protein
MSKHVRIGLGARRLAVPAGVVAGVMAGVLVVGVVQAAASGTATPPSPTPPSPPHASAVLAPRPAATGSPTATATIDDQATAATVTCGQTITVSTTLTANLSCPSSTGISFGANGIVVNLNGHLITGGSSGVGVSTSFASDTIENGYVFGFIDGVDVDGPSDIVTAVQTAGAGEVGVHFLGASKKSQLTNSTSEQGGYGVEDEGTSDTIKADHLLNNTFYGLSELGSGALVTGSVANGNGIGLGADGIYVVGTFPVNTVTGNIADDNGAYGIDAPSPSIDGGGNKAQGNANQAQCLDIVCA